jgi:hypothetical protein
MAPAGCNHDMLAQAPVNNPNPAISPPLLFSLPGWDNRTVVKCT